MSDELIDRDKRASELSLLFSNSTRTNWRTDHRWAQVTDGKHVDGSNDGFVFQVTPRPRRHTSQRRKRSTFAESPRENVNPHVFLLFLFRCD